MGNEQDIGKEGLPEDERDSEDKLVLGAVRSGQKDLVRFILPNFPDAGTIVEEATGNNAVRCPIQQAVPLRQGEPCSVPNGFRALPQLHFQVLVEDDPEIVLMLLARGGLVDVRNLQGRTVLNLAEAKKRCAAPTCSHS
jgi:hypothetical protein